MELSSITTSIDEAYNPSKLLLREPPRIVRKVEWPDSAWSPLPNGSFTPITGSRDPLEPALATPPTAERGARPRAAPVSSETEILSGERLALIVRKHSGASFSREEQARLLVLTERLEGRAQIPVVEDGISHISTRLDDVRSAMDELDRVLGFGRDPSR